MTIEELKAKKPYIDHNDIKELYGCGNSKSYQFIREIKSVSHILPLKGKVSFTDHDNWYYQTQQQGGKQYV